MSDERTEEALILVKAIPRPSTKHGETVCCAGITPNREWRRLFPIRFRMLRDNQFSRWQWIRYQSRKPTADVRPESRHVFENTIEPGTIIKERERSRFLGPMVVPSAVAAMERGQSLALVRPVESKFRWQPKRQSKIDAERRELQRAVRQRELFDPELDALEPAPYDFLFSFRDADGWHHHVCGDWETTAAFYRLEHKYDEDTALKHLDHMYNEKYPKDGMVIALGTMAKRPKTWLLLGIIRLDEPPASGDLFV